MIEKTHRCSEGKRTGKHEKKKKKIKKKKKKNLFTGAHRLRPRCEITSGGRTRCST